MRKVLSVATVVWLVFGAGGTSSNPQNSRTSGPIIEWPDTWVAISGYGPTKATVIDGGELFGKSR
jgi:hypothetical protein